MNKKIDINSVKDELHITEDAQGNPRTFGVRYVKSTGEVGEIANCRLNVKNSYRKEAADPKGQSLKYNLKYSGLVLLNNIDTGEYRSIKAAQMVAFRPHGRKNWIPIWH